MFKSKFSVVKWPPAPGFHCAVTYVARGGRSSSACCLSPSVGLWLECSLLPATAGLQPARASRFAADAAV